MEVHAIGDRALASVLDACEGAGLTARDRPIVTHCQVEKHPRCGVPLLLALSKTSAIRWQALIDLKVGWAVSYNSCPCRACRNAGWKIVFYEETGMIADGQGRRDSISCETPSFFRATKL